MKATLATACCATLIALAIGSCKKADDRRGIYFEADSFNAAAFTQTVVVRNSSGQDFYLGGCAITDERGNAITNDLSRVNPGYNILRDGQQFSATWKVDRFPYSPVYLINAQGEVLDKKELP